MVTELLLFRYLYYVCEFFNNVVIIFVFTEKYKLKIIILLSRAPPGPFDGLSARARARGNRHPGGGPAPRGRPLRRRVGCCGVRGRVVRRPLEACAVLGADESMERQTRTGRRWCW